MTDMIDRKKIKGLLEELSNSMTRQEGEREFQREAIKAAAENSGIDKKLLRKLSRIYHKQSFTEEQQTNEELTQLYESVVQSSSSN
jgi:hypothetical protein